MLRIVRAYEPVGADDGQRILIDRLWPRGVSKSEARIDEWLKDLAPSTELRKWFGHDPSKWEQFRQRYTDELASPDKRTLLEDVARRARHGTITLVYSARDTEHSDVKVLEELITKAMVTGAD